METHNFKVVGNNCLERVNVAVNLVNYMKDEPIRVKHGDTGLSTGAELLLTLSRARMGLTWGRSKLVVSDFQKFQFETAIGAVRTVYHVMT